MSSEWVSNTPDWHFRRWLSGSMKCGFEGGVEKPGGSDGKESACNAEDLGSIPGLGRSPGEGNGYPLQYSGLQRVRYD